VKTPDTWRTARATLAIAAFTAAVSLIVLLLGLEAEAALRGGFLPVRASPNVVSDVALAPFFLTPLTSSLLHANILHLAMNLLILLFCGRAVETIIGWKELLFLYLVGAYAAAGGQYIAGPMETAPMIGASGAISAVIGAYSLLFGRNRVKVANPRLAAWLNVAWLGAAWVVLQLMIGMAFRIGDAGIAVAAHIGGFLAGLLLVKPLLLFHYRRA
jgi:membrane associated rhomboid family serine protease